MPNANRHDIHVLNSLIQTAIDSADGYREASTETDDPGHRDLFGRRSFERRQVAEELQSTVRALGGDPADDGSILAKAQRAFASVRREGETLHELRHSLEGQRDAANPLFPH